MVAVKTTTIDQDQKEGELLVAHLDFLIIEASYLKSFDADKIIEWCAHTEEWLDTLRDNADKFIQDVDGHEGLKVRMQKKLYDLQDAIEDLFFDWDAKCERPEDEADKITAAASALTETDDSTPEGLSPRGETEETETINVSTCDGVQKVVVPIEVHKTTRKCDCCWRELPVTSLWFLGREPDDGDPNMFVNKGGWRYLCDQTSCRYVAAAAGDIPDPMNEISGSEWANFMPF